MWSTFATWGRRALTNANVKSKEPTPTKITRLVIAHDGILAVTTTYAMRSTTGTRSKTRCANTVPTSVAQRPFRFGSFRASTATRASSPIRPGRTAFANSPTEKAENTSRLLGYGGGIAWRMTVRQAIARATTEARLSPTAAATHCQRTVVNASPIALQLGPRHQSSTATTP